MAIRVFIKCWVVYWLLIMIAPFQSKVESPWLGILVQVVFFLCVLFGYFILQGSLNTQINRAKISPRPDQVLSLFWISIIFSVFGTFFLLYDRVLIQGIEFSNGLAVAREQWRIAGENRGGSISSAYSVLGYFLAPAFYYSIINLVIYRKHHVKFHTAKWLTIIIFIALNSILTGGRTVAFVAFILFLSSQIYTKQFLSNHLHQKKNQGRFFIIKKMSLLRNAVVLLLLSYSLYIFKTRSEANSETVKAYAAHALDFMGLEFAPAVTSYIDQIPFSSLLYLGFLFLAYLLHSYVITTRIYLYPNENESLVIFTGIGSILGKLGIIEPPDLDFYMAGKFSSLPGSLFLQGKFILLCFFGLAIGLLLRLSTLYSYKYPNNLPIIFLFVTLTSTLIASPVLFIFDTLMFPFIMIQFLFFSIFSSLQKSGVKFGF